MHAGVSLDRELLPLRVELLALEGVCSGRLLRIVIPSRTAKGGGPLCISIPPRGRERFDQGEDLIPPLEKTIVCKVANF